MNREEFFDNWSELHGGASIKGIVKWWLSISFAISRRLLWISPSLITTSALIFAGLYLYWISTPIAIVFLVLTLLVDGIDGTVALLSGKVSKNGAVLDAVIDRLVEAAWAYGLILIGAPWEIVMFAWLAAFVQEYMRARAAGLGQSEVGVVTICERPVRATLIFIGLVAVAVGISDQEVIAKVCASIWSAMQVIALVTLFLSMRSRLQQPQR
ncbi:MAG: CDP-alcohol phosphatidyltransferase family protein [Actinobacteria bacterium]|nr:CDP-alcohol phosphatidyltransferase family protein [Actinomycetota bacterium]